jgi:hypothetical protein
MQKRTTSNIGDSTEDHIYLYVVASGFLSLSLLVVFESSWVSQKGMEHPATDTELGVHWSTAYRFPIDLHTHFVLRQKLEDVNSRTHLVCPHCCHLSPPPLSWIWATLGLYYTSHLGLMAQHAWVVAHAPGLGVNHIWGDQTLGICRNCQWPRPEIGAHYTRSSSIPFQVAILQVDFSMHSTIWLTAVSGKRNNQIIIQSWVFNSRKASGC